MFTIAGGIILAFIILAALGAFMEGFEKFDLAVSARIEEMKIWCCASEHIRLARWIAFPSCLLIAISGGMLFHSMALLLIGICLLVLSVILPTP